MEIGITSCTSDVKISKMQMSRELNMNNVSEHLYALSISVVAQNTDVFLVFGVFAIQDVTMRPLVSLPCRLTAS
jgi:hypothetical protein